MTPNIFKLATKELSQDAFITWLIQWGNPEFKSNKTLNQAGQEFIKVLIRKKYPEFNEPINKVEAGRQWQNMDIWAEINNQYLIIIEDKTFSSQHGNQLEVYKERAEKYTSENNFKDPVMVYLKTGFEASASFREIEKKGYVIFTRTDFIALLSKFQVDIRSDIYLDFLDRLNELEKINQRWMHTPIKEWRAKNCWQGFFQFLEEQGEDLLSEWFYVNNPSKAFWAAITSRGHWKSIPLYVQIEEHKLCFKIATSSDKNAAIYEGMNRRQVRNLLSSKLIQFSREKGYDGIRRPNRFGDGVYMTIAVVDSKNWLGDDEELLDQNKVVERIRHMRELFNSTINEAEF